MRSHAVFWVIFVFCSLSFCVEGVLNVTDRQPPVKRISNAESLRRGLPLQRPVRLYNSTKPRDLRPRASGAPIRDVRIQVVDINSNVVGYARTDPQTNLLGVVAEPISDTYNLPNSGQSTLNLVSANPQVSPNRNVASILVGNGQGNVGNGGTAILFMVYETDPQSTPNTYGTAQSYVYNIPSVPGECTITWTNPDGNAILPDVYWKKDEGQNFLAWGAESDLARLRIYSQDKVTLFWVN